MHRVQEIVSNALDLAGGELIREQLDANFALLNAMNVMDTMMLELANSGKQIPGYKIEIAIAAGETTGTVDVSTLALDTKFVRWRRATTDRWEILDVVDDIEYLTDMENRSQQAIAFQGETSPATFFLSFTPEEAITLEVWGRSVGIAHGATATGSLTVQGRSKAKGFWTVRDSTSARATGRLTIPYPSVAASGSLAFVQPRAATGVYTFIGTPTDGETVVVNGTSLTFRPAPDPTAFGPPVAATIPFTNIASFNAQSMAAVLNTFDRGSNIGRAHYTFLGNQVLITYGELGTVGNGFTLASSSGGHCTRGSATLTGGVDNIGDGENLYVNGYPFVWVIVPPITVDGPVDGEVPSVTYLSISDDPSINAQTLTDAINASTSGALTVATASHPARLIVSISYDALGSIGNTFQIQNSSDDAIVASGPNLTGGVGGLREGITINVDGVTFTFSNANTGPLYIPFDEDVAVCVGEIADHLNASTDGAISVATYGYVVFSAGSAITPPAPYVSITYDTPGVGGNSFTLNASSDGSIVPSGATLTGGLASGVTDGQTILVNTATFTFKDTPVGAGDIEIDAEAAVTANNMAETLNTSINALVASATYTAVGTRVYAEYDTAGDAGLAYSMGSTNTGSVLAFAANLTRGFLDGDTMSTAGLDFTFTNDARGNQYIGYTNDDYHMTAMQIAAVLAAQTTGTNAATYSISGTVIGIAYGSQGSAGNAFAINDSTDSAVLASAPTLLGGRDGIEQGIVDTEIQDMDGAPPFPPEFSLVAAYRVADFVLNQLLIINSQKYRDFVIAQKGSLRTDQDRCEYVWKCYRFMPSDSNYPTQTKGYDVTRDLGDVIDDGSMGYY